MPFTEYIASEDERIRSLANTVAKKLLTEGTVALHHKSKNLGPETFKVNFWKTTYVRKFSVLALISMPSGKSKNERQIMSRHSSSHVSIYIAVICCCRVVGAG